MRPQIDYGTRSRHDAKAWRCDCGVDNLPKRKLIFSIPKFFCKCGKSYLDNHDLDFCLADVRVNGELLVNKIFRQTGPECMANSCCQNMLIMHAVDCLLKDKETEKVVMEMEPMKMVEAYRDEYPEMDIRGQSSVHKIIKMLSRLRNKGIKLNDGTFHKIGDVSFIRGDDYASICEETADGVPLLAVLIPGLNYFHLKYCEAYRPPLLKYFEQCNARHKAHNEQNPSFKQQIHEAHMVVLLGPAFKGPHRDFYFADSNGFWLPRHVFEDIDDSVTRAVNHGIGKLEAQGIIYNTVKFWQVGETAKPIDMRLEDEDDEATKYEVKPANRERYCGSHRFKRMNPVLMDPQPLKRLSLNQRLEDVM